MKFVWAPSLWCGKVKSSVINPANRIWRRSTVSCPLHEVEFFSSWFGCSAFRALFGGLFHFRLTFVESALYSTSRRNNNWTTEWTTQESVQQQTTPFEIKVLQIEKSGILSPRPFFLTLRRSVFRSAFSFRGVTLNSHFSWQRRISIFFLWRCISDRLPAISPGSRGRRLFDWKSKSRGNTHGKEDDLWSSYSSALDALFAILS